MNVQTDLLSRADNSPAAHWWWTVDRSLLAASLGLIAAGVLLAFGSSPAATDRLGIPDGLHFALRQAVFAAIAGAVLLVTSGLTVKWAKRVGLIVFCAALVGLVLTILIGPELNGAKRWLPLGPLALQPSEFIKPGLAVGAAFVLCAAPPEARGRALALILIAFGVCAGLLALQPDYGQIALLAAILGIVLFAGGVRARWLGVLGAVAAGFAGLAYTLVPHVRSRVTRFLNPEAGDTYQVDTALAAMEAGGAFGRGVGEGQIKWDLPDAHTDFIFAMAVEEYGMLGGLLLIALFALITLKAFARLAELKDAMARYAAAGLFGGFACQALINIGVSLQVMPAKGMTLPFVSYGGSSLVASALTVGLGLAFLRAPTGQEIAS